MLRGDPKTKSIEASINYAAVATEDKQRVQTFIIG